MKNHYYHFILPSFLQLHRFKRVLLQNEWVIFSEIDDLEQSTITIGAYPSQLSSAENLALLFQQLEGDFPKLQISQQKPVEWNAQWQLRHTLSEEGFLVLDQDAIKEYIPSCQIPDHAKIILEPGPGFGDLSHPTTLLTLHLLSTWTHHASPIHSVYMVDIGCGTGILSFFCALLPSVYAHGIDIDCDAIQHAKRNKEINGFKNLSFSQWEDLPPLWQQLTPHLALLNMLPHEQPLALASMPPLWQQIPYWIVSGIPHEEFNLYCNHAQNRYGWTLHSSVSDETWSAGIFYRENSY
jgi:ribosomal protein L11 methyltransferase